MTALAEDYYESLRLSDAAWFNSFVRLRVSQINAGSPLPQSELT
jgi:hypothetical protein